MEWTLALTCSVATICSSVILWYVIKRICDYRIEVKKHSYAMALEEKKKKNSVEIFKERKEILGNTDLQNEVDNLRQKLIKLEETIKHADFEKQLAVSNAKNEVYKEYLTATKNS